MDVPVGEERRDTLQVLGRAGKPDVREPFEEHGQAGRDFHADPRRAEAQVPAVSEREMVVAFPGGVELACAERLLCRSL